MELHAHERFRAVANAFVGAVVGVEEPRLPIRIPLKWREDHFPI